MARSFHTTRRELEEAKRQQYVLKEQREAHLKQLDEALEKKRSAKKHSLADRGEKPSPLATLPEQVPIRIIETGPYIHYPATAEDMLAVLRMLPAGVLDGIKSIELCLGAEQQESTTPFDTPLEQDPYVGRRGYELIPGVYHGQCLGSYWPEKSGIWLLAYVYDAALPDREMWEWYMRFHALRTLVHELAHHYDCTNRIARGRWRGDNEERVEYYAEYNSYCWTRDIVIPYLETTYPCQAQQFSAWLQYHGGVAIPLSSIIDKPSPMKNGERMYGSSNIFTLESIIESLAGDVVKGDPVAVTRLDFARGLHYGEAYAPALQILDDLLAEQPDNLEIVTLQADIYVHQERYDEAEQLARQVVEVNPEIEDAWLVLANVSEAKKDAVKLLEAIEQAIALAAQDNYIPGRRIYQRALARRWLNDHEGYLADIALLENSPNRSYRRYLVRLRKEEQKQL